MITKERAIDALAHQNLLAEIFAFEQERMHNLIEMALSCEHKAYRWEDYELLKKYAARIVGNNANHPELRTSAHYEVLLAFIDWMLPEEA